MAQRPISYHKVAAYFCKSIFIKLKVFELDAP